MKTADISRSSVSQLTWPDPQRDHLQGSPDSSIMLLEYGDYECPACGQAHLFLKAIQQQLSGDLCFAFRNFPLSNIHPHAQRAAEAAEAAGAQGKFWQMHDVLYENQNALEDQDLIRYAQKLGLDAQRLMDEVDAGAHASRVREDFISGVRANVNGTPTFFINGERYDGVQGLEPLLAALEQ